MSVDEVSAMAEPTPASPEQQANESDSKGEDPHTAEQRRALSWFDGKVGGFTLLLLDEFLTLHGLAKTASLLKQELQDNQIAFPSSELWFELYPSCHEALSQVSTGSLVTTMEKLVGFCLELPNHRRRSLKTAVDLQPVTVCASPKRLNSNEMFALSVSKKAAMMSAPSALSLMEAHTQLMRSPIVRPSRRAVEQSSVVAKSSDATELRASVGPSPNSSNTKANISMSSSSKKKKRRHPGAARRSTTQTNAAQPEQPAPGTYGEPALVQAHGALMKRDLSSSRLLERELRYIRLEKISESPKRMTAMSSVSMAESDPYLHALMLERYGFNKRQDCALCQVSFLLSNLPHRVSFKCVLDVYEQWQYTPPDLATSAKYKPPLCYDAVQVCLMCAQIIEQYSTQRREPHQRPTVSEPLSSARRARSMGSLPSRGGGSRGEDKAFCSDPYALPPLFGDDCYDHDDWSYAEDGAGLDENGMRCAITTEFPAKAIVYAQQQSDTMPAMSAKEWSVINPERSLIRQTMEESLANAAAIAIAQQSPSQHRQQH